MASIATVTGKVGPGVTMTAQVFRNVTSFELRASDNVARIVSDLGITYVDISADTTITVTVSSGSYTISVS